MPPPTLEPGLGSWVGGRAEMTVVQWRSCGSSVSTYSMLSHAPSPSLSPTTPPRPPRSGHCPRRSSAWTWSWLYRQLTSSVTSVSPMVAVAAPVLTLWLMV